MGDEKLVFHFFLQISNTVMSPGMPFLVFRALMCREGVNIYGKPAREVTLCTRSHVVFTTP